VHRRRSRCHGAHRQEVGSAAEAADDSDSLEAGLQVETDGTGTSSDAAAASWEAASFEPAGDSWDALINEAKLRIFILK
jgi:hypothetical protein